MLRQAPFFSRVTLALYRMRVLAGACRQTRSSAPVRAVEDRKGVGRFLFALTQGSDIGVSDGNGATRTGHLTLVSTAVLLKNALGFTTGFSKTQKVVSENLRRRRCAPSGTLIRLHKNPHPRPSRCD